MDERQMQPPNAYQLRTAINNIVLNHLIPASFRLVLINPIRLVPMVMWNLLEDSLPRDNVPNPVLEVVREWLFVEEHPGVLVLVIEPVLQLTYTPQSTFSVTVPRQHQKRSVRSSGVVCRGSRP